MKEGISRKLRRRARMTASACALWDWDKVGYRLRLRRAQDLTLPDFLGIGVQKAATNWLWENLRCHPDLFLPAEKELHYFDLHFYLSLRKYAHRFAEGENRLRGEITPAYSILPLRKIKFIRQIMPEVKLILILRNPVERAWSRAKMVLRQHGSEELDLGRVPVREMYRLLAHPSSLARGDYLKIIDNWLQFFPSRQLHVCFYDDISERPKEFLEDTFRFLGVRREVNWSLFPYRDVITPGSKAPIPDEYRQFLNDLYRSRIEELYQRFGSRVQSWRCL